MESTNTPQRERLVVLKPTPLSTSLSFSLPTSLSLFKRLTWEQTIWTSPKIPGTAASLIASHLSPINPLITPSALERAICFGISYPQYVENMGPKKDYPHVYIVFPHLKRDVRENETFIKTWHDEIVKPAFDDAWIDSKLVAVREHGIPGSSPTSPCTAKPASYIIDNYFKKGLNPSIHRNWPDFDDRRAGLKDRRVDIFDEAWESMKGILKDRQDLKQLRDPVLLAVWGLQAHAEQGVSEECVVEYVKGQWRNFTDERFVVEGSLTVMFDGGE